MIQAKKFEVVNDEGKVIVKLGNLVGGGVDNGILVTRKSKGQTLVELGVIEGGNGADRTQNGKGQTIVELGVTEGGNGSVTTKNGKGQTLVELGAGPDGGFVTTIEILPLLTICVWYQLGN